VAQSKPIAPDSGIGIVSVRTVFRDCKVNAAYRDKAIAEQSATNAELDALQKAVEAKEAGLRALKLGSPDYLTQYEELLKKQAELDAKKQFNSQQRVMKDRRWTEDLYKEVLRITKALAEQKGLTLVLEAEEPEFPMANADELMMALQTHKVLFSKGCVDLTAEVTAEMDKIESKFKM
jgi:Skp family chaperone for outer membrane proteins